MKKSLLLPLVGGAVLLGGWLSSLAEVKREDPDFPRQSAPTFPSKPDSITLERAVQRQTLPAANPTEEVRMLDPLYLALPTGCRTIVIFEASAIRESELGQMVFRCMNAASRFRNESDATILQFLENVDRIAVTEELAVAEGAFEGTSWQGLSEEPTVDRDYGNAGVIRTSRSGEDYQRTIAKVGTDLFLVGQTVSKVEDAIDRLDARSTSQRPQLDPSMAYGDIYGIVDSRQLHSWLPRVVGEVLENASVSVELHIGIDDGLLIVADFAGPDPERLEELERTVAAAIALGRIRAARTGDRELQALLEYSRVVPHRGEFRVEVALPKEVVAQSLGGCATARPASPGTPASSAGDVGEEVTPKTAE